MKGEGYILNFILYSFFRVFPIFDPRVFFRFLPLPFTRIYIKEFSNLHPSPFLAILLMVRELRVKGGEGTSLLSLNTFLHLDILRRVWLGTEKYEFA